MRGNESLSLTWRVLIGIVAVATLSALVGLGLIQLTGLEEIYAQQRPFGALLWAAAACAMAVTMMMIVWLSVVRPLRVLRRRLNDLANGRFEDDAALPAMASAELVALKSDLERVGQTLAVQAERDDERRFHDRYMRLIAQDVPALVAYVDRDLIFRFANRGYAELMGTTTEEIVGKSLKETACESAYEALKARAEIALSGQSIQFERQVTYPDGRDMWARMNYRPDFDENGEVVGYISMIVDIDEHKLAEAELKLSEQRLRDFAEAASDWFWEMGPDLRFTYMSEQVERITGVPVGFHLGKTREELATGIDDQANWARHQKVLEERKPFRNFAYWRHTHDGRTLHVTSSGKPVFDPDGTFLGYRGVGADLTKVVEAEHRAELAQQRLVDAVEALSQGFVLFDSDDRVVMCNRRFLEFFDLGEDVVDEHWRFIDICRYKLRKGSYPEAEGREEEWLAERLEKHRGAHAPFELRLVTGEWLQISERRTSDGGLVIVYSDISALKAAEVSQRDARAQAEAANKAKSDFLANMSHEIRTPMNAVLGMLGMVADSGLNSAQRSYVQVARDSAEMLLDMLNDLLDLSKLEAGKLDLQNAAFDLTSVVEDAVQLMAPRAEAKGLQLATYFDPTLIAELVGDGARLRQIILNLVGNAIKFTDEGGVSIAVRAAMVGERSAGLRIEVADTGIGIAVAGSEPGVVFERFSQLDTEANRSRGGTGLGLAICRHLVEAMGGRIGYRGNGDGGCTFWFELGLGKQPGAAAGRPYPGGRIRALVYETNDVVRATVRRQLEAWGTEVTSCDRIQALLEQAMTAAGPAPFNLVLLDQGALRQGPPKLLDWLGAGRCTAGAVIVLLSRPGHGGIGQSDETEDAALRLTKPLRQADLRLCLALARGESVPSAATPDHRRGGGDAASAGLARVLLVEDSPTNQLVGRLMLEGDRFEVDVAANGEEAVHRVQATAYDVVLMDVAMPVMDGLTATRLIRQLGGDFAELPIIAMTANVMSGDRERCFAAGMTDYITKPVERVEILAAIGRCLDGRAAVARPAVVQASLPAGDLLDLDMLRQLGADTGLDVVPDLIARFADEVRERADRIAAAAAAEDGEQLAHEAHALKSGSRTFGALALFERAKAIEWDCRDGRTSRAIGHCEGLLELVDATLSALSAVPREALRAPAPADGGQTVNTPPP